MQFRVFTLLLVFVFTFVVVATAMAEKKRKNGYRWASQKLRKEREEAVSCLCTIFCRINLKCCNKWLVLDRGKGCSGE